MRKSRFTETQIIGMINEQEAGLTVAEVCRKYGISPAGFYRLKAKYGGMEVSDARRLKSLEEANAKLKRLVADTMTAWSSPILRPVRVGDLVVVVHAGVAAERAGALGGIEIMLDHVGSLVVRGRDVMTSSVDEFFDVIVN